MSLVFRSCHFIELSTNEIFHQQVAMIKLNVIGLKRLFLTCSVSFSLKEAGLQIVFFKKLFFDPISRLFIKRELFSQEL